MLIKLHPYYVKKLDDLSETGFGFQQVDVVFTDNTISYYAMVLDCQNIILPRHTEGKEIRGIIFPNERDWIDSPIGRSLSPEGYKKTFWFLNPYETLRDAGYSVEPDISNHFLSLFKSAADAFYYLDALARDNKSQAEDMLKFLINNNVNPESYNALKLKAVHQNIQQIPSQFIKDVLTRARTQTDHVPVQDQLDQIIHDPKYQISSANEMDGFVAQVLQDNPVTKSDDRTINWLVGQVMKASKGKVNAKEVFDAIKQKLNP